MNNLYWNKKLMKMIGKNKHLKKNKMYCKIQLKN